MTLLSEGRDMDTQAIVAIATRRFRPIPGSRLLAGVCGRCGKAMRLTVGDAAKSISSLEPPACRTCLGDWHVYDRAVILTPRQRAKLHKTYS